MNKIDSIDLKNKNVVIRLDFNVPMDGKKITDNSKIVKTIPTLNYLLNNDCRICILSHLGRVKSEEDKSSNTLRYVAKELANLLNHPVKFVNACYGEKVRDIVNKSKAKDVLLLENTRFMDYPEKLESTNNLELAKYWASLGDVYINDAFASMHRAHASTAGIAKYLPHAVGFLVDNEITNLTPLVKDTPHPFTVFMGGAKVDDKLKLIKSLLPKCDYLLLGGGIANSFLKAKGAKIGDSLATNDEDILKELNNLSAKYKEKIVLPVDFTMDNGIIYDVGLKTIDLYQKYFNDSKIIFINGTCGKFEDERFTEGTKELLKALKNCGQDVYVGGGDTAAAIKKFGYQDSFKFVSSGGGATLEFIADGSLEALKWME